MEGIEWLVFFFAAVIAWALWFEWYGVLWRLGPYRRERWTAPTAALAPGLAALGLWLALRQVADHEVRESAGYLVFYTTIGLVFLGFAVRLGSLLGLSKDNVLERGNPAALWAMLGLLAGQTAAYAGANAGDGPGWWVVLFCAGLGMAALLASWAVYEALGRGAERIAVDRSVAAGISLGGLLVASGLIAGRAAAGDWEGAWPAVVDFVRGAWPVVPLAAIAVALERMGKVGDVAGDGRASPWSGGVVPAALVCTIAWAWVAKLGPW